MATATLRRSRPAPASRAPAAHPLWIRLSISSALAAAAGFAIAFAMPRGPITAGQALTSMLFSLTVGLAAGFVARSRWANLFAPLALVAAFEVGRRGLVSGPTIDSVRLDTFYEVLAFVHGRVSLIVAGVFPTLVGVSLGAALARRAHRPVLPVIGLVALLGLAVATALPASTPPIGGSDGQPLLDGPTTRLHP